MRIIVDVVHPADVHFYRHLISDLRSDGHQLLVLARRKDATIPLLEEFGIAYRLAGQSGRVQRWRQGLELLQRDIALVKMARSEGARVILTRNPAGVQAARLAGAIGIFDTDDGKAAGIHFRAAAPFAHVITTPDCMPEHYGRKHHRYPGYKALAYLHPHRFEADESVFNDLGLSDGTPYHIVRFVHMVAAHDHGESGLATEAKREAISTLHATGQVFVSSEAPLPDDLAGLAFPLPSSRLHDALAFASTYVGDSQTMAEEAAVLGVPSIRCTSWTGRLHYLNELEHRYGLVESFTPAETPRFLQRVKELSLGDDDRADRARRRHAMLEDKVDVTAWYRDLVSRLLEAAATT